MCDSSLAKISRPNALSISVVIPTFNRCELVHRTLQSVFEQTCPPEYYEVIVVVDGSTDGTIGMLRRLHPPCRFRFVEQPNRGQGAARNAGLKIADGNIVLFLDDDILCDPDLITKHLNAHLSGEDQVVFGPIYVAPESPPTLAMRRTRRGAHSWADRLREDGVRLPDDAFLAPNRSVPRTVLTAVGGYDEDQSCRGQEDLDLGLRLWCEGIPFRFIPEAVTQQIYVKSNRDLIRGDGAAYGRSNVLLCRKHPHLRQHLAIARYAEDSPAKRLAREWAARFSRQFDLIASLPCWLADLFPSSEFLEQTGLRVLSARRAVAELRSAVAKTGGWKNFKSEYGVRLPVLLYHHVGARLQNTWPLLTIVPAVFERQIRWLKLSGYTGIRCSDWVSWLRGEKMLPHKPVLLTFDDAYADIAENALPILKKYGFPATVFVVTRQIGGANAWHEEDGDASLHCMTAEQIRFWAGQGIEFGAHSRNHRDLRTLHGAELEDEVEGSRKDLSSLLGSQIRCFAYPYGYYSQTARQSVEKAFDLALTCDEGLNALSTNTHLIRRMTVRPNDTLLDLAFYLNLGHTPVNCLRLWWHRALSFCRSAWPSQPDEAPLHRSKTAK